MNLNNLKIGDTVTAKQAGKTAQQKAKELGLQATPSVLGAIKAYSDQWDDVKEERDLDYFDKTAISGKELVEIMSKVVEGYNDFEGAKHPAELVKAFGEDAEFHIAREGSVGIYVKPKYVRLANLKGLKSDEASYDGDKGLFRFWWD